MVIPEVPASLRAPCLAEEITASTLGDVARMLTNQVEALGCANGKILAVDQILTDAEARVAAK